MGKVLILSFLAVGSQIALWRLRQKNAQIQRELNQYQTNENLASFQALADALPFSLYCKAQDGRIMFATLVFLCTLGK